MPTIRRPSSPDNAFVIPSFTLAGVPARQVLAVHDVDETDLIAGHATLDRLTSIVSRTICTFTKPIASVVRRMPSCRAMNVARVANRRDARAAACTPDAGHVHRGLALEGTVEHDEKEAFTVLTFGVTHPAVNQQLTTARRFHLALRMHAAMISLHPLRARSARAMWGAKEVAGHQPESTVTLEHSAAGHDQVSIQCNQVMTTVGRGAPSIDDLPQQRDHLHQQCDHLTQQRDHLTPQRDHLQQRCGDLQHHPHKTHTGPRWLAPARRQRATPERSCATLLRRPDTHHAVICNSAPMTCNTRTMTCRAATMTCTRTLPSPAPARRRYATLQRSTAMPTRSSATVHRREETEGHLSAPVMTQARTAVPMTCNTPPPPCNATPMTCNTHPVTCTGNPAAWKGPATICNRMTA